MGRDGDAGNQWRATDAATGSTPLAPTTDEFYVERPFGRPFGPIDISVTALAAALCHPIAMSNADDATSCVRRARATLEKTRGDAIRFQTSADARPCTRFRAACSRGRQTAARHRLKPRG
jgi:hypothetical protein